MCQDVANVFKPLKNPSPFPPTSLPVFHPPNHPPPNPPPWSINTATTTTSRSTAASTGPPPPPSPLPSPQLTPVPLRHGSWLPTDHRIHHAWLRSKVAHVDAHPPQPLNPALQELSDLIETNPRIYMHFCAMWHEVPRRPCYRRDPTGERQIRDYPHMLQVLNHVFSRAPEWTDAAAHVGMVGVPLNAVFDYVMGTPSGHAAFLDPEVNRVLKRVLNSWGEFLKVCLFTLRGGGGLVGADDVGE